ncbi:MAG: GGDEF domain-containing protein [Fibrobacter sp.]|nr:GGDEF domain-containing protein [Fibrobacter sp.]
MVDLRTDHFIQYKSERIFSELGIAREGDDFFNLLISDARKAVYKEDFTLVTESLKKETLLKELDDYGAFTLTYRLNSQKGAVYVKMIAAYTDKEHLAISITNVDAQVRREQKLRAKILQNEVYGQIVMALAERYDALYMVDLETNHFAQYKAERMYSHLNVAVEGEDFFNQLQKDALQVIYAEDIPLVQTALVRDVLLKELDDNGLFSLTYRLNSPTGPVYVNLVAMYSGEKHIVISVTNIDTQVRREQKIREEAAIAYQKARRDDLTGIRNKNAYGEFERKLNEQIQSGEIKEFAIAICDVNELKTVNDTQGHKAGDEYIRSASKLICDTFKHSPVFRIGGDEFVAILRGSDFESRENLEKKFKDTVKYNAEEKKVVVACGIADFDKLNDKNVSAVFERADALMYKDKMSLKS